MHLRRRQGKITLPFFRKNTDIQIIYDFLLKSH